MLSIFKSIDRYGVKNEKGEIVVPCVYDFIDSVTEDQFVFDGLIKVVKQGRVGFVDAETGELVISCNFSKAGFFKNGYAEVEIYDRWGVIDKTGRIIIPTKYESINVFHGIMSNYIEVVDNGKRGLVDLKTAKEVLSCEYENIMVMSDGNAIVSKLIKEEIVNNNEKFVQEKEKYGLVNLDTGKELAPCKFETIACLSNGLIKVCEKGKFSLLDKNGKTITQKAYDEIGNYVNGCVKVKFNGLWGFCDESGKEVIPCKYSQVSDFIDGYAVAENHIRHYQEESHSYKIQTEWVVINEHYNIERLYTSNLNLSEANILKEVKEMRKDWKDGSLKYLDIDTLSI